MCKGIRSGVMLIFVALALLTPATLSLAADKSKADDEAAPASLCN
jgi:hypothetical protein